MKIGNRANMVIMNARMKRQARTQLLTRRNTKKVSSGSFKSKTNQSLLDVLNKNNTDKTNIGSLLENKSKIYDYGIVETSAERVGGHLAALAETGEKSVYEKEESKEAVEKELQSFVSNYNIMLRKLKSVGGTVNSAYEKKLKDMIAAKKEEFAKFGISQNVNGTLEFDAKTFRNADIAAAKEFFGGESGMAGKLLAQTQQIEKHAADQITALKKSTYALSSNYSRYGSSAYDGSTSGYKYNARG